jgi:hypothetical protein
MVVQSRFLVVLQCPVAVDNKQKSIKTTKVVVAKKELLFNRIVKRDERQLMNKSKFVRYLFVFFVIVCFVVYSTN